MSSTQPNLVDEVEASFHVNCANTLSTSSSTHFLNWDDVARPEWESQGPHYLTIMKPPLKLPPNMAANSLRWKVPLYCWDPKLRDSPRVK